MLYAIHRHPEAQWSPGGDRHPLEWGVAGLKISASSKALILIAEEAAPVITELFKGYEVLGLQKTRRNRSHRLPAPECPGYGW